MNSPTTTTPQQSESPHADAIKQQMQDTKSSIAEKLETLEQKVADRVEQATSAVTDTVETVKATVEDTVETVKTSVSDTVESVKGAFDLVGHVDRHPLAMLGGAIALGFVTGWLLSGGSRRTRDADVSAEPAPAPAPKPQPVAAARTGNGHHKPNGPGTPKKSRQPGFLTKLANALMPNFDALKDGVLASVTGVVKEQIVPAIMEQAQSVVTGAAEKFQENFTGKPGQADSHQEPQTQESDWFTAQGATRFPARN